MCSIFVRFPFSIGTLCLSTECTGMDYSCLRHLISAFLRTDDFLMYYNGKEMSLGQYVPPNSTVLVSLTLPGGKGGFGSMLRAIGAQIEKTTNREACRDLSGRRLRDINEEQRLKKWIAKKAEREAEKVRRRKERIERLKSTAKHNFVDFEYEKAISSLPERIDDALTEGIQKVKKRPLDALEPSTSSSKKKSLWLDEDNSSTSDSDSDLGKNSSSASTGSESESEASCSKKFKSEPCASLCIQDSSSGFRTEEDAPAVSVDTEASEQNEDSLQDEKACMETHNETIEESDNLEQAPEINTESEKNFKDEKPKNAEDQIQESNDPVDLLMFNSMSDLEALGLVRLKSALMTRGLKCGGNITDRAQRLWAVRGLEQQEYPKNLLAKQKK